MKKLFSIIAVLFVMAAAAPKVAHAAEGCVLKEFCGHMAVVCDDYDYVTWDDIYCPPID